MPCFLSTKESKCKKVSPVEQITNRCSMCEHVFCREHFDKHGTTCPELARKQTEELSTLKTRMVACVEDKLTRI